MTSAITCENWVSQPEQMRHPAIAMADQHARRGVAVVVIPGRYRNCVTCPEPAILGNSGIGIEMPRHRKAILQIGGGDFKAPRGFRPRRGRMQQGAC